MAVADQSQFTQITEANFASIFANVKNNDVQGITLHWTVGLHQQLWDDYQFCVTGEGNIWMNKAGWDENGQHLALDHMSHGMQASADPLAQLWHRNTGNVGISWCSMYEATEPANQVRTDLYTMPACYGPDAPTKAQVDSMAWLTAMLVRHYNLNFTDGVKSHYQWAVIDGYADERWDLKTERDWVVNEATKIYGASKPK